MLFAGLFLSLNAQQIQPVKKQTGERINMSQIQHIKSAKNNDLGWVYPADAVYSIVSSTGATYYSNVLFQDSTVVTVSSGTAGVNYNWTMAVGQVFDPYSAVFDPAFTTPLLAAGKSYYIDSICILGWYMKRTAATDTLILEFAHNAVTTSSNSTFDQVYIPGSPDTLWFQDPLMHGNAARFGYYAKLTEPAKTIKKYVLPITDTTMAYGKYIAIPVGLTIPANHITALSLAFVPGSTNAFGDTIKTYGGTETSHINSFTFGWYSEDASPSANIFYDPFGHNLTYMITTNGRYVSYSGGSTALMNNIMYPISDGGVDIGWNIEEVTGINEVGSADVKVFPNPSNGLVNIELAKNAPAVANFYNLLGEVVKSVKLNNTKTAVNLTNNPSGIYMLRIEQGNNVITKKVILK